MIDSQIVGRARGHSKRFVDELVACAKRQLAAAIGDDFLERPFRAYHYTDANGLLGIVEEQTLRATHSRFMNDHREGVQAANVVRAQVSTMPDRELAEMFEKLIDLDITASSIDLFIASLTHEPDLLSQWRAYGSNGMGYALGINLSGLAQRSGFDAEIWPAIYDTQAVNQLLETFLLEPFAQLVRELRNRGIAWTAPTMDAVLDQFRRGHALASGVIKQAEFAEEREVRVVRLRSRLEIEGTAPQPRMRAGRFGLTPYEVIPFGSPEQRIDIHEIVVGPCHEFGRARYAVECLLRANGYDTNRITISHASVSYL